MAFSFYTSVAKGLELKVSRFCGKIPGFAEVTEEKLVGALFVPAPILNRVKRYAVLKIIDNYVESWTLMNELLIMNHELWISITI